jgi:hypothetical protein
MGNLTYKPLLLPQIVSGEVDGQPVDLDGFSTRKAVLIVLSDGQVAATLQQSADGVHWTDVCELTADGVGTVMKPLFPLKFARAVAEGDNVKVAVLLMVEPLEA